MNKFLNRGVLGIVSVFKILFKGYILKKKKGSRFANKTEIKDIFEPGNKGLLIDGLNKRLSLKDSFQHLAVISAPGSGKTTGFILPNLIDKASQDVSVVVTDPSGELYKATSSYYYKKGFNVLPFNPNNPKLSVRNNPFSGLGINDVIEIEKICVSLVMTKYGNTPDQLWNDGAISLLSVLARSLANENPEYLNLPNINYLLMLFGEDGSNLNDFVIKNSFNSENPDDKTLFYAWYGLINNHPKMLQTYCTIAKTCLSSLNNYQVQELLSDNDIDLDSFRKKKTIIYLMVPSAEQDYWQYAIDMFYTRLFSHLMKTLPGEGDKPVFCFLEEFGSSYINNFQTVVNNMRKYQVSISIVLQSIAQIEEKYKGSGASVRGGIGSYLILSGADYKTADEFSKTLGSEVYIGRNHKTEEEERYQKVELLRPEEITRLKDNQGIFVSKNTNPQIINFTPYYKNKDFKGVEGSLEIKPKEYKPIKFVDVGELGKDFEKMISKRKSFEPEREEPELEK